MADLSFGAPVGLPAQQQGQMSIADMLGMARGAQQYQKEQATLQPAIEQAQAQSKLAQTQERVAKMGESEKYANAFFDILGGFRQDPRLKSNNPQERAQVVLEAKQMAKNVGVPELQLEALSAPIMTKAAHSKDANDLVQTVNNVMQSRMGAAGQQGLISGQVVGYGKDVQGNPTMIIRDPNTGQQREEPLPVGGGVGNVPQMRVGAGESPQTIATMQEERDIARRQASSATPALANIQAVRKYLPLAQTGKGSESIAGLQSVFGNLAGSTAEEKAASARDIVEKSIADLSAQKNVQLGGKFQADLAAAQNSIATAGKNPTAILKSMEMLEPVIQHSVNYQKGLENVIAKYGTIQAKRMYDNAMIDAYDTQAMMVYNAYKAGNKKEFENLTKGMSESQKEALGRKMQKYNRLIEGNLQ